MKFLIVSLALVAAAAADVSHLVHAERTAEILRLDSDVQPNGYHYNFETSNGISGQEQGALKAVGQKEEAIVVTGNSRYTAPDGQVVEITYTADENGYQPQGSHIPTPHPIPEAIARSIEYNLKNAAKEVPQTYQQVVPVVRRF